VKLRGRFKGRFQSDRPPLRLDQAGERHVMVRRCP
jgi:hypothetical protein